MIKQKKRSDTYIVEQKENRLAIVAAVDKGMKLERYSLMVL
jgi:hypothetical protein